MLTITRDVSKRLRTDTRRITGIGIPAPIVQLQREINDRLVVRETAAHYPVPCQEARQMAPHMKDFTVVEISKVVVVADGRSAQKSVNGRVDGGKPCIDEGVIVSVGETGVFQEVLEVGVGPSAPGLVVSSLEMRRGARW